MASFSKRIIVLILVGVLAAGFVFASKSSISVQLSPFAYQKVRFDNQWNYGSSFGFGAKAWYKYYPSDNFAMGVAGSVLNLKISSDKYLIFNVSGEMGFLVGISNKIDVFFDIGFGADCRVYRGLRQFYPAVSLSVGSEYYVAEPIALTLGSEFRYCQQTHQVPAFSSADFNLVYYFGFKAIL